MSNMVGVGPFITIPLIIAAMGGPQCMLGWLLGALLAMCDGLVWSELAAAMPGTGGSYLYLSEAFRRTRFGGLLPFLFIWQFVFSGYYDICYLGGEVRNPERVIPRSIIFSVLAVAVIYALCNLSIIAVVPWREAVHSRFIASQFIEKLYGTRAASAVTVLVLWT